MDTYGITPKGQQDRRWAPPVKDEPAAKPRAKKPAGRYGHLRPIEGGAEPNAVQA
jgi:hypothetical protein